MSFDAFSNDGDDLTRSNSHPFGDDHNGGSYTGYDPRQASQRYDGAFGDGIVDEDYVAVGGGDQTPFGFDDGVTVEHETVDDGGEIYGFGSGSANPSYGQFESVPVSNGNGQAYDLGEDGPVLPPPSEMQEEGYALREWRRLNAIGLAEKERIEKEKRIQIILDAEEYIQAFYEKRKTNVESKKVQNREKEKSYLTTQEKFHKEADKQYWKAIAELVPNEVPNIEKRGAKKDKDKKPSITVIQGPKPGKPTDLSRMRHILTKLKHTPPPHMIPPPPKPAAKDAKDPKTGKEAVKSTSPSKDAPIAGTPEAAGKDAPVIVENPPPAAEPQSASA
uniref:Clathrin light chain n=1 Tax=Kalanchoe fedtschenkoi TaxID=63787 RepID=A0A7N0REF7_KALFE